MKQTYTIGELAELAGVSIKTLRVYEKKGLLLPERNTENGYRVYTEDAVSELEKIQLMKYLDFSLDQIGVFLKQYETVGREELLQEQKRLLERKRFQLESVIACVDRAILESRENKQDRDSFLKSLGSIVKNRKADELVGRLQMHSDEPRGWSRYVFEQARLEASMKVMDAGAGYGNLWRYNLERLPEALSVTCVDLHHTHADSFYAYISEKEACGELAGGQFSFVWEDLELMKSSELFHCIFFNHVASFIQERKKLYEKFRSCLLDEGRFICTWGGYLLYENLKELLDGFLEGKDREPVERRCQKAERYLTSLETELFEVFPKVERHSYTTTLVFAAAEEFADYIVQVCRAVEPVLEERRNEFLAYLQTRKNEDGTYTFVRDTYLYCCSKEV